jgi:hypothetical protein
LQVVSDISIGIVRQRTTEDNMTILSTCCGSKFERRAPKLYRCRACSTLWALTKADGKLGLTRATYYHTGIKG